MKHILVPTLVLFTASVALSFIPAPTRTVSAQPKAQSPPFVKQGSSITQVATFEAGGVPSSWQPAPGRVSIVLNFNPSCQGCDLALEGWRELLAWHRTEESLPIDIIFSTSAYRADAREYLLANGLDGEIQRFDLSADMTGAIPESKVRFLTTPQTIVLDGNGRAARVRVGPWAADELDEWTEAIYASLATCD